MVSTTVRPAGRGIFSRRRTPQRDGSQVAESGRDRGNSVSAPSRLTGSAQGERGILLARRLSGERALPVDQGRVVLSLDRLRRHMLVCGATGAGKTETLLRIAWTLAKSTDAAIFYLDGKGDLENAKRFTGLMADAGRTTRVFPNERFDAWRGGAHEIHSRLMEIIDYATDGPASWYRDLAKTALWLACEHPEGPPRSSQTLLARLDLDQLAAAHTDSSATSALTKEQVRQIRIRYEAFFRQTRGALDGTWAWEDTTAGYLLLDSLALKEEVAGLWRLLNEDFAHYFAHRKAREKFCLLIVDEFSSLAGAADIAGRVEQARGFNASIILAPQVTAGMGDPTQTERILGSVETIICHRVNTPETVISLAGTKQVAEHSIHYAPGGATGEGSMRTQHQYKVDPNKVRTLPPGNVYIINKGRAMRAQILQAPHATAQLPTETTADGDKKRQADDSKTPCSTDVIDRLRF
jgi:Bacterial protein of unknown function (DUF853)